jgi:LmbE family N-acetylglucosaminyl deacetylase
MKRSVLLAAGLAVALMARPRAQMRVVPLDDAQGHVALGLALRHLGNAGIYMMATAHPDDENNGLLVMLNRGQGYRTALATATRGNGGQNEIGPELFEPLGVLRTGELEALHRFDGTEQYFTRAVDFGYTIDIEETLAKWGRAETIGDYVRLIRTVRPDVVSAMAPVAPGQHAHHVVSAVLSHEAYTLAGDPTKYPEQIREGLRAWQPKKFYYATGFGIETPAGRTTRLNIGQYDPLLGKTYAEIGTEARSMHKCQGQAQLLTLPGPSTSTFQLAESAVGPKDRDEKGLFDGVDASIAGLARFAGPRVPKELAEGLALVAGSVQTAQKRFDTESDAAALAPLLAGLRAVRVLRGQLRAMPVDDTARYEIDFRLRQKEREFQQAALVANGVRLEALADDGVVVPGQAVKVSVIIANQGLAEVAVKQVKFDGFDGEGVCVLTPAVAAGGPGGAARRGGAGAPAPAAPISSLKADQVGRCEPTLSVPAAARVTEPYWHRVGDSARYAFDSDATFGLPFRPTPFYVQVTLAFPTAAGGPATEEVIGGLPVQYRYDGNIFSGEKRMDVLVAPAMSVRMSPDIVIIPAASVPQPAAPHAAARTRAARGTAGPPVGAGTGTRAPRGKEPGVRAVEVAPAAAASREIRVTVVNDARGAADGVVRLAGLEGWTVSPAEEPVTFTRQDEARTVRFQVQPAPGTLPGEFRVRAQVSSGGQTFDRGYQVIEYPHIRRQHIYDAAVTTLKVIDVKTAPNLTVGYVMGTGDQVASAIEQLGAKVEMIGPDGLAWGDLAHYDTIVLGVRAYERRDDLRVNNSRLLEYVRNGGTLIVQYNRATGPDAYGPYPASISNNRITDEHAPVQVLDAGNALFTTPNILTDATWQGWVQERGLNFLGEKDSRYRDLVKMADPFPDNPGDKLGALVEAPYGKGRWLYVALGLWRELPAGVDGAYPLLANLISLGKASTGSRGAAVPGGVARPE